MNIKQDFFSWLDSVLVKPLPDGIKAFNFNLYEGVGDTFHVQLIGASRYSKDDSDWACDERYSTEENIFLIPRVICGEEWEKGQSFSIDLVKDYLNNGHYKDLLKAAIAIGVGFVDGDIEIIYEKNS